MDGRRGRGFEVLERLGRASRDRTAKGIKEAVALTIAAAREENRRGVGGRHMPECFGTSRT